MMKRWMGWAVILGVAGSAAGAQENKPGLFPPGEVDQLKVDKAIEAGIKFLKAGNAGYTKMSAGNHPHSTCELVLYTYANSGVLESDPAFKELFDDMMKRRLEATYCVALQAMILEEVERFQPEV